MLSPEETLIRHLERHGCGRPGVLLAARRAIALVSAGRFRERVELPDGRTASALEVVDRLRLERFVLDE